MSRWKRLGVVISIVWLIGSPIYFLVDESQSIERKYEACMSVPQDSVDGLMFKTALCNLAKGRPTTIPDLLKVIEFRHEADPTGLIGVFFWLMWLGPIALLWIVGGTLIGTHDGASPHPPATMGGVPIVATARVLGLEPHHFVHARRRLRSRICGHKRSRAANAALDLCACAKMLVQGDALPSAVTGPLLAHDD